MKEEIIQVRNLVKNFRVEDRNSSGLFSSVKQFFNPKFRDIVAVDDVTFNISRQEFVAFIGSNGAGKTTTLKCLSGLLHPNAGSIQVAGHSPWEMTHSYLRKISLLMGNRSQLWWELPAVETFLLNKEIYQIEDNTYRDTVEDMVDMLGIQKEILVPVRKLSLGERMKCELVASLIHTPEILFLDEPTIGLDVLAQQKVRDFLKEYNKKYKATIILTSHNMEDVQDLCKRGVVIEKGKIIYDGKISELKQKFVKEKYVKFVLSKNAMRDDLEKLGRVVEFDGITGILEVPKERSTFVTKAILSNYEVEDIDIEEVTLESVVKNIFDGKYKV